MAAGAPSGEGVGVGGAALEGLTELPPVAVTDGVAEAGAPGELEGVCVGETVAADVGEALGVPDTVIAAEADGVTAGDSAAEGLPLVVTEAAAPGDPVWLPVPELEGVCRAEVVAEPVVVLAGVGAAESLPLEVTPMVGVALLVPLLVTVAEAVADAGHAIPLTTLLDGAVKPSITCKKPVAFITTLAGLERAAKAPTPSGNTVFDPPLPAIVTTAPLGRIARTRLLLKSATKIAPPPTKPG